MLMKPARDHEHNDEKKNTKKKQKLLEASARDIYEHDKKKKKEKYWVHLDGEEKHIPKAQWKWDEEELHYPSRCFLGLVIIMEHCYNSLWLNMEKPPKTMRERVWNP